MLILASASPRRKDLMKKAGYRFRIVPSNVPERTQSGLTHSQRVEALALKKAKAVAKQFPGDVVLGADTLVFINGHAVGKPRNARHAIRMLAELSGEWQQVITGVAVVWDGGAKKIQGSAISRVKFKTLSKVEIEKTAHKHLDKAGAYAVQEKGDGFVNQIKGDYDNVVGLPMRLVKKLLDRLPQSLFKTI